MTNTNQNQGNTMMPLDITKPVQTRDGRSARIVCTDRRSFLPVMALLLNADGTESLVSLTKDFKSRGCIADALVNIPEKRTLNVWINVYPNDETSNLYTSETDADGSAGPARVSCIHIVREYVVGEGMK